MELRHELSLAKEFKDLAEDFRISSILELCNNNERYAEIDIKCKVYYQEMSEHFFKQAANTLVSYLLDNKLEVYLEPKDRVCYLHTEIVGIHLSRLIGVEKDISTNSDKILIALCNNSMEEYFFLVEYGVNLVAWKEWAYGVLKEAVVKMLKHNTFTINGE